MYKSLCIALLIIVPYSCNEKEPENGIENLTEVNLIFKDYNPSVHKSFIDLTIENSINPITRQLKISDIGTVSYNFINHQKTELIFNYENREFSLIASPNENLIADLKISELLDWSKFRDYKITGQNERTNNLILGNTFYLDSLIKKSTNSFTRDGTRPDIDFKNKRISEMLKQLQDFENFISENRIDDNTFIDWSKAQIRYRAANDLSFYPYFGPVNRGLSDDSSYFDFVKEVRPEQQDELTYQAYLIYLQSLSTSYKIMSNVSDKYKSERERLKKDSTTNFSILFKIIKRLPKNNDKELIMAYAYQNNKKVPAKYQDSLQYVVSIKLQAYLKTEKNEENLSIVSLIENYDIPKKEKDELLEIYKNTDDKVIFHDFWFSNCAPCMQELPHYNDLIATTNDDVVFIFYGAYMRENEWKKTRKEFGLKGRHHLLTKNQLAFFEKYFGVHGFPHHQLINSNGQIVKETIQRVYPSNFEYIKSLIEKHNITNNNGA